MKWKKLGQMYVPSGNREWMKTHASVPIAEYVSSDLFKIYFSSRDSSNRSVTSSVIIDIKDPTHILEESEKPILPLGELGCFDDSGSMASWITLVKEKKFLYYIGWNLGVSVPFRNAIGLAIDDGEGFVRYSAGPIVDRSMTEPHFCASCCVIMDQSIWKMWYLSCVSWDIIHEMPRHRYHIKYAESHDGINWIRDGNIAIDFSNDDEYAISRPSVIKDEEAWKMWFSYRGDRYRIGYAESKDGKKWVRKDNESGIDISESGWDSEMVCYPFVFDHEGERYMLYNGNGYGKTGFGLAILENG